MIPVDVGAAARVGEAMISENRKNRKEFIIVVFYTLLSLESFSFPGKMSFKCTTPPHWAG